MPKLTNLKISGWKSIPSMDLGLELGPMNVFIGANGAGKSNIISFFKMLNEMIGDRLQDFIGRQGGADSLLHFGSKVTDHVEAALTFETETGESSYSMRLAFAAGDSLIFTEERLEFMRQGRPVPLVKSLGAGHRETKLNQAARNRNKTAFVFSKLIGRCRVFHFHDTSATARARQTCYLEANRFLFPDAGNLAALLFLYKRTNEVVYRRIVSAIRTISPFFHDFVLEPRKLNPETILLKWKGRDSDYEFGPHQLSDGTIRVIALATLLLQPTDDLPDVIIIDEPELGLHPHAVEIIAGLIRSVSIHTQVILATQSSGFVDHFEPEEIVVTEIENGCSRFRRLKEEPLHEWLEDYSVGQLWEKNVVGGGPVH